MLPESVEHITSEDNPLRIDLTSVTHSVLVAEAGKTDATGDNPSALVDELQMLLNPTS